MRDRGEARGNASSFQQPPQDDEVLRARLKDAHPGADYLLQAFAPRKGFGPKGLGRDEIERRIGQDWRIVQQVAVTSVSLPRFLRDATASWYWLRRT